MAALPAPLTQVAGAHIATYEAYYRLADSSGKGAIGALDAATFLKKSGLGESVLSQIWDFSDPSGKGYLDKQAFFVALKLIALAQNGQEVNIANVQNQVGPPNMGEIAGHLQGAPGSPDVPWIVPVSERTKYDQIFDGLQPVNGLLSGDKVKPVLLNSKLPVDVLGRVWDLSDIDKDGFLDREEFSVAMHLVYKALEKEPVPLSLPLQLIPPSKRKRGSVGMAGAVQVLPPNLPGSGAGSGRNSPAGGATSSPRHMSVRDDTWIVNHAERVSYGKMFAKADTDMDGLVGGAEVKDIFIQSGVHQAVLAHIWTLCDLQGSGKLNTEQFCLAMHFIQQKMQGVEPPQTLTPEMIPPSMRTTQPDLGLMDGGISASSGMPDLASSKELETISNEIEELKRQKMSLEQEKAQTEADIKIRYTEVSAFEKELDAVSNTLKQLENQKAEAQKRLDELDDKKAKLENTIQDLKDKVQEERRQVDSYHAQINNQEANTKHQEEELERLRVELNKQREEEAELEQKVEAGRSQLETVLRSIDGANNQVNQVKGRVQQLQESHKQLQLSISQYTAMVNGDPVPDKSETPTLSEIDNSVRATAGNSPVSSLSGFSVSSGFEEFKEDPFKSKDPFPSETSGNDPFNNEDPFKQVNGQEDPFKGADPFKNDSGFAADPGFSADPFAESDPFAGGFGSDKPKTTSSSNNQQNDFFGSGDPFGGDSSKNGASSGFGAFDSLGTSNAGGFDAFSSSSTTSGFDAFKTGTTTTSSTSSGFDAFGGSSGTSSGGFDAFSSGTTTSKGGFDAFGSAFSSATAPSAASFSNDPFDPFGGGTSNLASSNISKSEGDLLGLGLPVPKIVVKKKSGDAFGSDPFAPAQSTLSSTHPRPRRVKSPAPAPPKSPAPSLPPKQKKMPPPRPPAPKSKSPVPGAQSKSSTPDPFGGGSDPFGGMDPFGPPSSSSATSSQDPFGGSLNLPGNDPFSNGSQSMTSAGGDPFANFADFSPSKFESSETSQLAWATYDSKKMEEDRLQRQKDQEQADLELAIMLSKAEMQGQSHA